MDIAGRGAAEWGWRLSGGREVTVLCGPGNNGGDGYVIAEAIREKGGVARVVAATEPKTDAARNARSLFGGEVLGPEARVHGEVFVDCLFGSGLTRALTDEHFALLTRLAASLHQRVAIDLPSGVQSDTGAMLNEGLPQYDLTICLGAWKYAHFLMPAAASTGAQRLVGIGVDPVAGAAQRIGKPGIAAPAADAHKYRRGLLAVVGGAMPGAALLAARAAQRAGAGYVKLFTDRAEGAPHDLVVETGPLSDVLTDDRNRAILVGPGLGRDAAALERLVTALADSVPAVIDADGLAILGARLLAGREAETIATPHEGELATLEKAFGLSGEGAKPARALALAQASGMVIVAKGPDTVVAAPDGRLALAPPASSWLSVAGTGDVLAGIVASRLATGHDAFAAACEGVWLHGEAARLAGAAFTAGDLAETVPGAIAACL
jgi:hydroxyethylthiazole kinase-like uncharacterized protein yjeF